MRSPCRTDEPVLRPLASLKSERFAPLAMDECHSWIGNAEDGFEVDGFDVECLDVDWPSDCCEWRIEDATMSVRIVRASMRGTASDWREC